MSALEELKKKWGQAGSQDPVPQPLDEAALNILVQFRLKKQNTVIFRHFWATFVFHLVVYALLSHVVVRYHTDTTTLLLAMAGILLTVPLTVALVKRYSRLAASRIGSGKTSIRAYITEQQRLLSGFFRFKKIYELVLIPLHSVIGVVITFRLFVPGGVSGSPAVALIIFMLTLLSCLVAVRSENRKNFREPLGELRAILDDYSE